MKYKSHDVIIPQEQRDAINQKILMIIDGKVEDHEITKEDIFNSYTGRGGLHGLDFADFDNYHEFSEAKKDYEIGQFFTPPSICEEMVNLIRPGQTDLVCDPTCGTGNFFNFLPCEQNAYGCELDPAAAKVAKHLYPEAKIIKKDIREYNPGVLFDYVFGNPPFNLNFYGIPSQLYFCIKAEELLKPGGLMVLITPMSFLNDEFIHSRMIERVDRLFNFVCQYRLDTSAFRSLGVARFETKVMVFQKKSLHITDISYTPDIFQDRDIESLYQTFIKPIKEQSQKLRAKIILESRKEKGSFDYQVNKLLYQVKTNKKTAPHYGRCQAKVHALKNQQKPYDMTWDEWKEKQLTPNRVISYLKQVLKKQHEKEIDRIAFVKTGYGFSLKAYSRKMKKELNKQQPVQHWSTSDLVFRGNLPGCDMAGVSFPQGFRKLVQQKTGAYQSQGTPFDAMFRNYEIDRYLEEFRFMGKDGQECRFNDIQKRDLGLCLQKRYSLLNWQMGSGKTAASYAWATYNMNRRYCRNIFIVSAAISINLTWLPFMKKHEENNFIMLESFKDIDKIKPGMFVLVTLSRLVGKSVKLNNGDKYQLRLYRFLKDYIRRQSYKVGLVFDESDEITNPNSKRSKAVLSCFRKVKYKLLATGTTTRNNITELYKQLELLYNNSVNMLCTCDTIYSEVKDKDEEVSINGKKNEQYYNKPFPAYYGSNLFKACFNPSKTTVFGIKKHNQDIFNKTSLIDLIKKTIITRLFKEIAGPDRYEIKSHILNQNPAEVILYGKIINQLQIMIEKYFQSTGSERKDQMLQIIRQLNLLIKATSTPHTFKEYREALPSIFSEELQKYPLFRSAKKSQTLPNKYEYIEALVKGRASCLVAVGCTTHEAAHMYYNNFVKKFPEREVFLCLGNINFNDRNKILKAFEASKNGILVATQQSLKSSVNIPTCNEIIIEALPWNVARLLQFCFRFVRYDSTEKSYIHIVNYENTIDMNLFALLLAKERINDFVKTLEFKDQSDIYGEFDVNLDILDAILSRSKDSDGRVRIEWGMQNVG